MSALSEFDLIRRYFLTEPQRSETVLGGGDDCALLQLAAGQQLAVSTDMLVSGRHFFPDAEPFALGHKALAVNLSDLAAMGAEPVGFTLSLALPEASPDWLGPFSQGLLALAQQWQCDLIGGDTTKGPLTLSITVFGAIPPGQALRRDAARAGDDIWISGTLGDARLALAGYRQEHAVSDDLMHLAAPRMHAPSPRIDIGLALRGIAHAAIDISDGLTGDLSHILQRSGVSAEVMIDALPRGAALARCALPLQRQYCAAGGDDYELCFTAPPSQRSAIEAIASHTGTPLTRTGAIVATPPNQPHAVSFIDRQCQPVTADWRGFDHFSV